MKNVLLIISLFLAAKSFAQTHQEMPLYKNGVPNSIAAPNRENLTFRDNVLRFAKVSVPSLTMFKPVQPNGRAVIICPGGSYSILAFDKEGTRVAEEMNKWGVTAFVLKYRLPDDTTMVDRSVAEAARCPPAEKPIIPI